MIIRCTLLFLAAVTCALAQTTIYFDDFSGSAEDDLNGRAPTIRPGGETWFSSTGSEAWKADGSVAGGGEHSAFLPFTPVAGNLYTLSFTAHASGGENDWIAIGFAGSASVDDFAASANPSGWLLLRDNRETNPTGLVTFLGPSLAGEQGFWAPDGSVSTSILLDTTGSDWAVKWFIGDTMLREESFLNGNPEINYIGIGKYGAASGDISSLSVTQATAVPEPSTYVAIAGACVLGFAAWRRRRANVSCG